MKLIKKFAIFGFTLGALFLKEEKIAWAESIPSVEGEIYAQIQGVKYQILDADGKIGVFVRSISSNPTKWRDTFCRHGLGTDYTTVYKVECSGGTGIWQNGDRLRFKFGEDWGFTWDHTYSGAYGCDQSPHSFEVFFTPEAEIKGIKINGVVYPVSGGRWENKFQQISFGNTASTINLAPMIWFPPVITPTPTPTLTSTPTPTSVFTPTPTPTNTPTPIPTRFFTPTPTLILTPTPRLTAGGWFQTREGDVHSGGEIRVNVPAGKVFSLDGEGGFPGVISYQSVFEPDFSPGGFSSTGWLVKTEAKRRFYRHFYLFLGSLVVDNFDGYQGQIAGSGVYYSGDDVELENKVWNFPQRLRAVILVEGNLKINSNILVPQGSFLAFIVKGNIEVSGDIENLQGVYITDGELKIEPSVKQFIGEGIFIAQSFSLNRDLGTANSSLPAEKFVFRPDLVVNSFPGLQPSSFIWEEIAP